MAAFKPQRIRDPLHNLIEFGRSEFEQVMWRVIQTRPFQRLRRIKQLGFSDLVYPGATHTRFAHSVGVFHTARQLMHIIEDDLKGRSHVYSDARAHVALAAALVHDIGHGMFSHAFEAVGKELDLKMAHHEQVSDILIRDGEVSEVLNKDLGSGFANDVADVIKRGGPGSLYDAVVSSQFDADRLDYMQRDRLMTVVQNSGIDFAWLIKNLEIRNVGRGVDDADAANQIETFVLGPKATHAAEAYVLSLFQLYPTVYLHKTTRGAEKAFFALMLDVIRLVKEGSIQATGLPANHPIAKFAMDSNSVEHALALDDSSFWGALPLMAEASDCGVQSQALRFLNRRLPKCIDVRERLISREKSKPTVEAQAGDSPDRVLERRSEWIKSQLDQWPKGRVLVDSTARDPYKRFDESKGPLNQIRVRAADDRVLDLAQASPVVAAIKKFHVFRAYVGIDDQDAKRMIDDLIDKACRSDGDE